MEISRKQAELLREYVQLHHDLCVAHEDLRKHGLIEALARFQVEKMLQLEINEALHAELKGTQSRTQFTKTDDHLVVAALRQRHITVQSALKRGALSQKLDFLALHIYDNIGLFSSVVEGIRTSLRTGKEFHLETQVFEGSYKELYLKLIRDMAFLGMFDDIAIGNAGSKIFFKMHPYPQLKNFFQGEMYERYVCRVLERSLMSAGCPHRILSSVKVILPYGEQHELDLVGVVGDVLLWVEIKAHNKIDEDLAKYLVIGKALKSSKDTFSIVLRESSKQKNEAFNKVLKEVTIVDHRDLESHCKSVAERLSKGKSAQKRRRFS